MIQKYQKKYNLHYDNVLGSFSLAQHINSSCNENVIISGVRFSESKEHITEKNTRADH